MENQPTWLRPPEPFLPSRYGVSTSVRYGFDPTEVLGVTGVDWVAWLSDAAGALLFDDDTRRGYLQRATGSDVESLLEDLKELAGKRLCVACSQQPAWYWAIS